MSYFIRMFPSQDSSRSSYDYSLDDYNKILEFSKYDQTPYTGKDAGGLLSFPFNSHDKFLRDVAHTFPSPQLTLSTYKGNGDLRFVFWDNAFFIGANLVVENETVYISKDCELTNSILLKNCNVVLVGGGVIEHRIFFDGCKIRGAVKKDGYPTFTGTLGIPTHAMPNISTDGGNSNDLLQSSVFINCEITGVSIGSQFGSYTKPVFKLKGCKLVKCDFGYIGRKKHDHMRGIIAEECSFDKTVIDGVKMVSDNCDGTIEIRHTKQTSPYPVLMVVGKTPKVVIGKETMASVRVVNATDSIIPLYIEAPEVASSVLRGIALNGKFDIDIDEKSRFTVAHDNKSTVLCTIVGFANSNALEMGIKNNSILWNKSIEQVHSEFDKRKTTTIADITIPSEKLGLFGGYSNPTVTVNGDPVLMFVTQIIGELTVDGKAKTDLKAKELIIKSVMGTLKSLGYADRNHLPEILDTIYSKTSKILRLMGLTDKQRLHYMKENKTLQKWWFHNTENSEK
jgi:hypothetical protein